MSTQRGNASRTRAQKHKNRATFRNDLHDKTTHQKKLNSMHVSDVCQHCKSVIEWKIKYKKYKPLTQPKTCTRCGQRNVTKAYHVLCRGCALESHVCAKCLKSAEEVEIEPAQPTPEEELKLKVEMERLIKSFPERKRRAFLRYMAKGKKDTAGEDEEDSSDDEEKEGEAEAEAEGESCPTGDDDKSPKKQKQRIPHSRDELLRKIEELKLVGDDEEDENDTCSDSKTDSDSYESEEEKLKKTR